MPIEASDPSGLEMDKVRCFRLSEDLFFRRFVTGFLPCLGEPGMRPVSIEPAWLRAGVAGEAFTVGSIGLWIVGCGDGAVRPVNWECCGRAGTLNVGSATDWLLSKVAAAADLG